MAGLMLALLPAACKKEPPPPAWQVSQQGDLLSLRLGTGSWTYRVLDRVDGRFRVMGMDAPKSEAAKADGVLAEMTGIPLRFVMDDRPISTNELRRSRLFLLLATDEAIRKETLRIAGDKRAWRKVELAGLLVRKEKQNGAPARSTVPYVYVTRISGTKAP